MTPDDVAAIRAEHEACGPESDTDCETLRLAVALEAAWEDIEVSGNNWARNHALMRERAEKAEVEVQRRNDAIIAWQGYYEQAVIERGLVRERAERAVEGAYANYHEAERLRAALARVRALCDRHADWGWRSAYVRDIRAAIDGDIR